MKRANVRRKKSAKSAKPKDADVVAWISFPLKPKKERKLKITRWKP